MVLLRRMADEMILGDLVLPVGAGDSDYLRAGFLGLGSGVDCRGVDSDVVEDDHHVARLQLIVFDNRRAEIHSALELEIFQCLIEHRQRRPP